MRLAVAAVCVTLMVCAVTPVPLIVIVAVRADTSVLADAVTVTAPLFVPEAGETVSHAGALLFTVQLVLEVIINVFCWLSDVKLIELVEIINSVLVELPDCKTVMVCAVTPVALTVMVAVRAVAAVLAEAVTVTVALFVPEAGETVSHVGALLLTVQSVLDVTVKDCSCPAVAKLIEAVDSVSVGG